MSHHMYHIPHAPLSPLKPHTHTHTSPEHHSMRTVTFLSTPLFLWHTADGFVPSGNRLPAPAAAPGSAASRSSSTSSSSRSVGCWSRSQSQLSVSTQTEEELREKLARDNEDLSEVNTVTLPCVHTSCNGTGFTWPMGRGRS